MSRVAVIVQRCDESVVGGSESLAWQYAELLKQDFEVDVLTSTAKDYMTWNNELPSGPAQRNGVTVRRFPVEITRQRYWFELHGRLLREFDASRGSAPEQRIPWRSGLQEEFVKFQGPYCPALTEYLRNEHQRYEALLFCTYLYPTTYFGAEVVPSNKAIFVPTLHDEPTAYLSIFRERFEQFEHFIWLTSSEREVAERLWGKTGGYVLGMAVAVEPVAKLASQDPYLLYCGRIEQGKGCHELVDAFVRYKKQHGGALKLVFTGADNMGLPNRRDIEFLGFVDERRKFELMAGATAFVLSSEYESFSIVTLEAMAQRTPVILNGRCTVLKEHIERSQAGWCYGDVAEMMQCFEKAIALGAEERAAMGERGRRYVVENYTADRIHAKLLDIVKSVARGPRQEDSLTPQVDSAKPAANVAARRAVEVKKATYPAPAQKRRKR